MLTPEEFIEKWGADEDHPLRRASPSVLATVDIPTEAKHFLLSAGLPDEWTSLSFSLGGNQPLPRLADKYLAIGYLQPQLPNDASWYWYIGRSGAGDPVCIDGRDGAVMYLNHDNRFERILINSSVPQLAESILAHGEFYGLSSELLCFGDDNDEENSQKGFTDSLPKRTTYQGISPNACEPSTKSIDSPLSLSPLCVLCAFAVPFSSFPSSTWPKTSLAIRFPGRYAQRFTPPCSKFDATRISKC